MVTPNIAWLVALALAGASAEQPGKKTAYRVTAYLVDGRIADPFVLERAESLASSIFAGAGINLRWASGAPSKATCSPRPETDVTIRLSRDEPADSHPGAQAYSLPYAPSGVQAIVFYDRALEFVRANPKLSAVFLSHVLAHEIVHVLQGVAWHSESGLMKSQWSAVDLARMKFAPLPLAQRDVMLIRRGMESGDCQATR